MAGSTRPVVRDRTAWNSKTMSIGFAVKLALMMLVDALGIYIVYSAWINRSWLVLGGMVAILAAVNYTYFTNRRTLPTKYILPGVIFLLVFQIFAVLFNAFIAFTNYGDGHRLNSAEEAARFALRQDVRPKDGGETFPATIMSRDSGQGGGSDLYLAIIRTDGSVWYGNSDHPLAEARDATIVNGTRVAALDGYVPVTRFTPEVQQAIVKIAVPVEDQEGVVIKTDNAMTAYEAVSTLTWDPATRTITDTTTGQQYHATDRGYFRAEGETEQNARFTTGWRVMVGLDNFVTAFFSNSEYGRYFGSVVVWTFVFAFMSVFLTFVVGTFLAIVLNDERIRGRKIYRTLLLLPYAFPPFLGSLVWRNLLLEDGFINQVLLGGLHINWLQTQTASGYWLARASVLLVQIWLGFPYMFLIATGALQALPVDIKESAAIDGANPIRLWLHVTGPLLLVSTAPILVASFAFNFNNFTLIYMLTKGGPSFGMTAPIGATDILITMVYRISGVGGQSARADLGLAAALSIVIFIVVAAISIIGFKQTRRLEEMV